MVPNRQDEGLRPSDNKRALWPVHRPHVSRCELKETTKDTRVPCVLKCTGVMVLKVNEAIAAGQKIELKPEDFKV